MTSQTLREARKYEETVEKSIAREERPDFHLCSRVGWMNDPNGFSYHNGMYHMFYQYYPYESKWGPMHWGHAVSAICSTGNISRQRWRRTSLTTETGAFREVR